MEAEVESKGGAVAVASKGEVEEMFNFDAMYLVAEDAPGGMHLATPADVKLARAEEVDEALLLTNQAEMFCTLIVMHGFMPSDAYLQAFSEKNEDGELMKPTLPAYQSRMLLRQPEIKARIEEIRNEVIKWGKTTVEEVEANYRRMALDPLAKHSDRIAATKALCALRGFDAQPENLPGMTINIQLPFTPNQLGRQPVTIDQVD